MFLFVHGNVFIESLLVCIIFQIPLLLWYALLPVLTGMFYIRVSCLFLFFFFLLSVTDMDIIFLNSLPIIFHAICHPLLKLQYLSLILKQQFWSKHFFLPFVIKHVLRKAVQTHLLCCIDTFMCLLILIMSPIY